jgi:cytoskeletal protein CcmA (bactofilin family)
MIFRRGKPEKRSMAMTEPVGQAPHGEPSYIASDTSLEGNINSDGEIHIDGELRGHVRAHTCLVDRHGEVIGGITAQYVVVRGRVLGPINATQVTIQSGAHVEGNVVHEGLSIENGAFVMGSITQSNLGDAGAAARTNLLGGFNAPNYQPAMPSEPMPAADPAIEGNILPMKAVK